MKMTKNEYLRSMARHATLLCCIVPFIAAASAKAASSYEWDSYSGSPDGSDFSIELSQSVSFTSLGQTKSIAKFDSSTFSSDFRTNLSHIDSNLPYNNDWTLSSVIIELEGTVGSVTFTSSTKMTPRASAIENATPTITVGSFTLAGTTYNVTFDASSSQIIGVWDNRVVNGNDYTWTRDAGGATLNQTDPVTITQTGDFLNSSRGNLDTTLNSAFAVTGVEYEKSTWDPDEEQLTYTPLPQGTTLSPSALNDLNLTLNIRYLVTPEPGTMALLLTGIPLFLVRRRKSWKK